MTDDFIKKALEEAFNMYSLLLHDRMRKVADLEEVDERIAKIKPKIVGLAALTDDIPEDSPLGQFLLETTGMGITDAVRDVLRANRTTMTPVQIRDSLVKTGYDLTSKYVNPVAILHNILKRLHESSEVVKITDKEGKVGYRWNTALPWWGHKYASLEEAEDDLRNRDTDPSISPMAGKALARLKDLIPPPKNDIVEELKEKKKRKVVAPPPPKKK